MIQHMKILVIFCTHMVDFCRPGDKYYVPNGEVVTDIYDCIIRI